MNCSTKNYSLSTYLYPNKTLYKTKRTMRGNNALNKMENNKTPVNDDLTIECFETFWIEIRSPLPFSFEKVFLTEELSTSQKQSVIKLLGKKDKD